MKKLTLGTKWFGHDSCIFMIDPSTNITFGMSTERVTRFKHDTTYPIDVIRKMNDYLNISVEDISEVTIAVIAKAYKTTEVFYKWYEHETVYRQFLGAKYIKERDHLSSIFTKKDLDTQNEILSNNKFGMELLKIRDEQKKKGKVSLESEIKRYISEIYPNAQIEVKYYDHQLTHAISSFCLSGFDNCLAITSDGEGDGSFSKVFHFNKDKYKELASSKRVLFDVGDNTKEGSSLGNVYQYFTRMLGFSPFSEEGKVEALAAYGDYNNKLFDKLMEVVTFDEIKQELVMNIEEYQSFFSEENFEIYLKEFKKEDIAASVQKFLENKTLEYIKFFIDLTGIKKICLSGGTVANVITNMKVFEELTDEVFVMPAMADDGTSLGAVILSYIDEGYSISDFDWLKNTNPYFGTSYTQKDALIILNNYSDQIKFQVLDKELYPFIADKIKNNKIGALFQNRMEWGPRALGNRSIIANPRDPKLRDKLNLKIKKRPYFQPFCPSILIGEKERLFENSYYNRHMTTAFSMKKEYHEILPAAIHIDGTSRVQFVSQNDNPNYFNLLNEVKKINGFGILINTSFNMHGRTIVESIDDAITDFLDTDLDFLLIDELYIERN